MEILDKHFIALPKKRKIFVFTIGIGYLVIALIAYNLKLTNMVEGMLIVIIGILYTELIKLHYRVDLVERNK